MKNKMILITGSNGFVGHHLCTKLEELGYSFTAFGSKDYDLRERVEVDNLLKLVEPDIIIHLAASVGGIGINETSPAEFMYNNLIMGVNLIDSAHWNGYCKKFIMTGTICSYPKFCPTPFKEKDLWNGYPEETNAPYGIAKKALGELGFAYNKEYGLNFLNLLPTNMYGPYDNFNLTTSHVIPAIIKKVWQAKKEGADRVELWGTGTVSRDFLYVGDFVNAVLKALDYNAPECINIGTGVETKISDLAELICKKLDFTGKICYNSDRPDGQPRRCVDISKAKYWLNWKPETDLDKGLDITIDYAKHHIL